MLTLEKCRELLTEQLFLTDEDLGKLRDQLYALAELALSLAIDQRDGKDAE